MCNESVWMRWLGSLMLAWVVAFGAMAAERTRKPLGDQPLRVACVGNSITYGMGIEDREVNAYPAQLQRLLGKKFLVGNFGHSGATLLRRGHRPYVEQEAYRQAVAFAGDVLVIHLGINDTDPRNWPNFRDEFVSDYLALIDSLRQGNPSARVLVARLSPIHAQHPRFETGTRDWHAEIQLRIEEVARLSGAQLIDFYQPLLPFPNFLPDNLHPDAHGAALLAQTVYSAITGDYGGLSLPDIYTDGMVLQRDRPLAIRGTANAGERIRLSFGNLRRETTTPADGQWVIHLPALPSNSQGQALRIESPTRRITLRDVLVGEVWLASGQSNMAYSMNQTDGAEEARSARDTLLRLFDMKELWRTTPEPWSEGALDSVNRLLYFRPTRWLSASPEGVGQFSAVAYRFARHLRDSLDVPVGIICNALGGSPIESWIDRPTLEHALPRLLNHWRDGDYGMPWARSRAYDNIALRRDLKHQRHPYDPTYLFDAAIRPLGRLPIAGVIWYQGESNAHNVELHARLFPLLLSSWRNHWAQPDLPFYFVQLSSMERPSWPHFRDSQRQLARSLPHVWMAVSSDHGHPTDVHPRHKTPVALRLALQALRHSYGLPVRSQGPDLVAITAIDGGVRLEFDDQLHTNDGTSPRGFEVAAADGAFYPATAEIDGCTLTLRSHLPVQRIRYAYRPYTDANLVGPTGLPVSTFAEQLSTHRL